ncbi:hypothetical protein GQ464_002330 [Rhodocaloribacter litoris]|uniref:hypothetical protein n=1 Tax=Rhodocaloribacter litoris TaxID=2558931 RepID=UPI001E45F4D3|nr:hypothetical protein [Rhodocaloribacter litoris]QXD15805.1 hypothetical protein GQ464_002330 [Rhodocaloribacter litoris]
MQKSSWPACTGSTAKDPSRRDAILHSVGANAEHGLRRTGADKRRAVMTLLQDEEWRRWSDREIARRCRVSHPFVAKMRADTCNVSSISTERTFKHWRGGVTTMDTSRIGGGASEVRLAGEAIELLRATPVADDPAVSVCTQTLGAVDLRRLVYR